MNRRTRILRGFRLLLLLSLSTLFASCEDPQIYGSVGFSSFSGSGWGGGGVGTSVSIGGRIR